MIPLPYFVIVALLVGLVLPLQAQSVPLFDADEPISIQVIAPLKSLKKQRGEEPDWLQGGQVIVKDNDGVERILDVQIKARGNFRRQKQICAFPPYWLNFKKSQVAGTVFGGPCRHGRLDRL